MNNDKQELLKESDERTWYLVKEWTTEAGLKARIHQCVWKDQVKAIASSLHDFYCGYVQKRDDDTKRYYDNDIDVHGGVTHEGDFTALGLTGTWVGYDMAHLGDENRQNIEYATKECERLAKQMI